MTISMIIPALAILTAYLVTWSVLSVGTRRQTPQPDEQQPQKKQSTNMCNMKIYISGKITGLKTDEYLPLFEAAEQELIAAGVPVENIVNPCKLGIPENGSWGEAMKVCLAAMDGCTAIYMLRNWNDSIGARRELNEAGIAKMDVYFEVNHDERMIADCINAGIL